MSTPVAHDLAALVAMRLTHDLAGPLGAVATAIDLLDGGDHEIRALIADGAATAVASLRLHRFILSPTDDGSSAHGILAAWVAQREGVTLDWRAAPTTPAVVLGLAMTATESSRRAGTLTVDGDAVSFAPAPTLDPAIVAGLSGAGVTTARGSLAALLHADAVRRGGAIAIANVAGGDTGGDTGTLRLTYHGRALPR